MSSRSEYNDEYIEEAPEETLADVSFFDKYLNAWHRDVTLRILPQESESEVFIKNFGGDLIYLDNSVSAYHKSYRLPKVFSVDDTINELENRYKHLSRGIIMGNKVSFFNYGSDACGKSKTIYGTSDQIGLLQVLLKCLFDNSALCENPPSISYSLIRVTSDKIYNELAAEDEDSEIHFTEEVPVDLNNLPYTEMSEYDSSVDVILQSLISYYEKKDIENDDSLLNLVVCYQSVEGETTKSGFLSFVDVMETGRLFKEQGEVMKSLLTDLLSGKDKTVDNSSSEYLNLLINADYSVHLFNVHPHIEDSISTLNSLSIMNVFGVLHENDMYIQNPPSEIAEIKIKVNQELLNHKELLNAIIKLRKDIVESTKAHQVNASEIENLKYTPDDLYEIYREAGRIEVEHDLWKNIYEKRKEEKQSLTEIVENSQLHKDEIMQENNKISNEYKMLQSETTELRMVFAKQEPESEELLESISRLEDEIKVMTERCNMLMKVLNVYNIRQIPNMNDDNVSTSSYYTYTPYTYTDDTFSSYSPYRKQSEMYRRNSLLNSQRNKNSKNRASDIFNGQNYGNFPLLPPNLPKKLIQRFLQEQQTPNTTEDHRKFVISVAKSNRSPNKAQPYSRTGRRSCEHGGDRMDSRNTRGNTKPRFTRGGHSITSSQRESFLKASSS